MSWPWSRRTTTTTTTTSSSTSGPERLAVRDRPHRPERRSFAWLGGRRRLAAVPYLLPADEREVHRLDFQHYLLRYALQGNYSAPIDTIPRGYPASILDVGCGTGRWAFELAAQFPAANIVGVDLSPTLDETTSAERRPDNFTFVQANVLQGLPFADATFEYVHQRLLFLGIPALLWPGVAGELARVARPGGWVELAEGGVTEGGGPAMATLAAWAANLSAQRGIDLRQGARIGEFLRGAGLQGVVERRVDVPIGRAERAARHVGQMMATNFLAGLEGLRPAIIGQGQATAAEFDGAVAAVRAELARFRCVLPFYIAYGRRPRADGMTPAWPSDPSAAG
jgi:ubiquinone/menaquinone biosynthesis C-methylase UbiE